jgi:hypothetical protein
MRAQRVSAPAAAAVVLAIAAASCQDPPIGFCDGHPCAGERTIRQVFESAVDSKLDLLFVIDDSPDSASFASRLAAAYPRMATELQQRQPAISSLHAGFVAASASVTPLSRGLECGLAAPSAFLISGDCGAKTNFAGSMEDAFTCLPNFGIDLAAPVEPLATLRRTLAGGANGGAAAGWEGFLRPDATLFIVVVAGQDDASGDAAGLDPVSGFVDFVRGLKTDVSQVVVSLIGAGDCGVADGSPPASRLVQFMEAVGADGVCVNSRTDPTMALSPIFDMLAHVPDTICLSGVRDGDLATPGVQADCAISDTVMRPDGSSYTTTLPSCQSSAPPCYSVTADPTICPGALTLTVDRGPGFCSGDSTRTEIECLGCSDANDPACSI